MSLGITAPCAYLWPRRAREGAILGYNRAQWPSGESRGQIREEVHAGLKPGTDT